MVEPKPQNGGRCFEPDLVVALCAARDGKPKLRSITIESYFRRRALSGLRLFSCSGGTISGDFKLIPSFRDILSQLNWIPLELGVLAFFITGSFLVLIRDWRVSVGTLMLQYLILGFALSRLVRPEIAFAKVMVGLFVTLMLYLSARQAGWRQEPNFRAHGLRVLFGLRTVAGEAFPPGRAFRLMALLLIGVVSFSLSQTYPISNLPTAVSIAVYWLLMLGLLVLILSENPLKVGSGLLTAITGFELWYTTLEGSLLVVGLWGIVNLLLALSVGYLAAVRGVILEEDF